MFFMGKDTPIEKGYLKNNKLKSAGAMLLNYIANVCVRVCVCVCVCVCACVCLFDR